MWLISILLFIIVLFACLMVCNSLYRRTLHYQSGHAHVLHMLQLQNDEYDLVNVGSTQASFGLDYTESEINADNWAAYPQYFSYDLALLKQYSKHIKRDAIVLLPISVMEFFCSASDTMKQAQHYYAIVDSKHLPYCNIRSYLSARYPLLFHPLWIRFIIRDIDWKFDGYAIEKECCTSEEAYIEDAKGYIQRWNRGFETSIPSTALTENQKQNIDKNIKVLREMTVYCKNKGWQPIFILLPATKYLTDCFTDTFIQECVISPIKEANADTPFLNYWGNKKYMSTQWYMNSLLLNVKGRKQMTRQVVEDVRRIVKVND